MVDSSFVLALALDEPRSPGVQQEWNGWAAQGLPVLAPSLLGYELAGVLRNKVHRGVLEESESREALDMLLDLPIDLVRPEGLHHHAFELATGLGLPASYDAHYLALAEVLDADLWTLDERFHARVAGRYPRVRIVPRP